MIQIPLSPVPAQSLNITLDTQPVALSIYTLPASPQGYLLGQDQSTGLVQTLFMDVVFAGSPVLTGIQCLNLCRCLAATQYTAFVGDFIWVDTQGSSDPYYTGLGTRFLLQYLEASDLG